jgi:hypothetical protein
VTPERTPFNVTHRIRAFSFGLVLPEAERPLEGVQATMAEGTGVQRLTQRFLTCCLHRSWC